MGIAVKTADQKAAAAVTFRPRAETVAIVAKQYAAEVDRDGRFPHESLQALKEARLLGMQVAIELGGDGASLSDVAEVCTVLGQDCASTAMIFAMHQIKTSSLVSHGRDSKWHRGFMQTICDQQLLLASATTEGGVGGDMRSSICAIEPEGDMFRLHKEANVISYGSVADAILITARRNAEASSSDQVMAVVLKGQYNLQKKLAWDTLGMRGTCSEGFKFDSLAPREQILDKPFADIAGQSMLATAHILWGSVWFGIASDAIARARMYVRNEARKNPGTIPNGAVRLTQAVASLQRMKADILDGLRRFEAAKENDEELSSVSFAIAMNNLKVNCSTAAADIVREAMLVTGINGYRNDSPYSVSRHMRDAMSAAVMVNNDRIVGNVSKLMLIGRNETSLFN
jgi:acyl-CoA dehydrogenase